MAIVTDVFTQNHWGAVEFDENVVRSTEFKPQLLGGLNLFEPIYSRSSSIAIASKDGALSLIPTSELGAPLEELIPKGAKVRVFHPHRLAKGSTIMASELAGVLALPFEDQLVEIADEVTDRTGLIMDDLELTWEHMRFGAIQGVVYDADGTTVLHNWYTEWGITQPAEINFALSVAGTDVRAKCREVGRKMRDAAKGAWTPGTRIGALVGDTFYDSLLNHPQIKETYLGTERAVSLEGVEGYSAIDIENITFINYRGTDDKSKIAVPTDKAKFFPIGARGVFKVGFGPAQEFKPYLNRRAREYYGMILADPSGREAWDRVEVYSYPLFICTRPGMLQRGTA
ncbi:major capsid protein [Palleronia sp.]|uniref:major capsid protein n=1 Tax=Palleronia sp. TaxID=1940284 RepID=UPI0035C7E366